MEVNTKLCEMYKSNEMHEKREALLDELERLLEKSQERRDENEKNARAEISRLEDEIKKQKEENKKHASPVSGRVSSSLYISDEDDTPPEDSQEDSPDEEELELMSKSTMFFMTTLIQFKFQLNKKE